MLVALFASVQVARTQEPSASVLDARAVLQILGAAHTRAFEESEKAALVRFLAERIEMFSVLPSTSREARDDEATAFTFAAAQVRSDWPGADGLVGVVTAAANAAWRSGSAEMVLYWQTYLANRELTEGALEAARDRLSGAIEYATKHAGTDGKALESAQWLSARLALIQARIGLSEFDQARHLLDEFDHDFQTADSPFRKHTWAEIEALGLRAQYWLDLGRADLAADASERQLAAALSHGKAAEIGNALIRAANIGLASRSFEAVIERCESARSIALESHAIAELEIRKGQAERELELQDPQRPRRAAQTLRAALSAPELPATIRLLGLLTLVDAEIAAGNHREALAGIEKVERERVAMGSSRQSRGAVIAARLATLRWSLQHGAPGLIAADSRDLLTELNEAVEGLFADWKRSRAGERLVAFLNRKEYRDLLAAWIHATLEVEDSPRGRERCFDLLVRAQCFGSLAEALGANSATLAAVRRDWLGERGLLLVYMPAVEGTILLCVDDATLEVHSLAGSRHLEDVRRGCLRYLSVRPEARTPADSRVTPESAAREFLPREVMERLGQKDELTVVGYEQLGALPFEAFIVNGRALGLTHSIVYTPSLPVGLALGMRASQPAPFVERSLVALDRPALSESVRTRFPGLDALADLADSESELMALYGRDRVAWFTGPDATRERLAIPSRILQIFAHGVYDSSVDPPAALALAPWSGDAVGLLAVDDLPASGVAPLVIQASCSAAKGPLVRGEDGLSHFGGAWLRAGAITVVLPSQDVNAYSTQRFLELFHEELVRQTSSVAEAARAARERLANDPRFADPYFFAPIHVYGFGRERLTLEFANRPSGRDSRRWIVGFAALIAIGTALRAAAKRSRTTAA